jgi:hypothetical protein
VARKITDVAAVDRLDALHVTVKAVRRGGEVSVSGVHGGEVDPMPMMEMFDRGIQLRMGQAHVKRWTPDLMPMVADSGDPLGGRTFAPHHLPLDQARHGYEMFRDKADGCIKVVLQPCPAPFLTRHEAPGGSGHGVPSRRQRPLSSASVSCGTQGPPVGALQADALQALSVRVTAGVDRQAKRTGSTPQCG